MTEIPFVTSADRVKIMLAHDPFAMTREPFPAPQRTSRELPGFGTVIPAPVLKLAEFAREHSWEVRTQYSQGHMPHATTGRPGALKDLIALRFGAHPMTDRQAYAVYSKPYAHGTWTWGSVMIWGPDLPPYGGCGIADLRQYLSRPDWASAFLLGWVAAIKREHAEREAAKKAKPKPASKPKEDHA